MKTVYQANRDLANAFGKANNTYPTTLYIALSNSSVTTEVGFTEVSNVGTGYARVAVSNIPASFTTPTNKSLSFASTITFPTATASWSTIYSVGIYDSETSGHLLYYQELTTPKTVDSGDTIMFGANSLTITEI